MKHRIKKYNTNSWQFVIQNLFRDNLNMYQDLFRNHIVLPVPFVFFFFPFILPFLKGCTDPIDWDLKYQQEPMIVVEAKITNEYLQHEVKLTEPVYEINGTPVPVSGALVRMSDGDTMIVLQEDRDRVGFYLPEMAFRGVVNRTYRLSIQVDTLEFRATARMLPVTDFQNMIPYRVQRDPLMYELWIGESDEPAVVKLELDWSHLSAYIDMPDEETHALIYHYTLPSIDVNEIFQPEREHIRFPSGTIAYRSKESVTQGYGEFLRGMLSETIWRGGIFDVMPGNANNNFNDDRALGYFIATTVIRDTVVIDP